MQDDQDTQPHLATLTSEIVVAYVASNPVSPRELPELVSHVLAALRSSEPPADPALPAQQPAIPINKSITQEAIICLECGQSYRSMRHHLRVDHGLQPDEYRHKWGLPSDYPIVAPTFSARRSEVAKKNRLGRSPSRA